MAVGLNSSVEGIGLIIGVANCDTPILGVKHH